MQRVLLPQIVIVSPRQTDPEGVSIHDVGCLTTLAIKESCCDRREENCHRPISHAQFQASSLEHQMSPMHVVDRHEEPHIEGHLCCLVVTATRHDNQIRCISCSCVQQTPCSPVEGTTWPPEALHTHQPVFAIFGLFKDIVLDKSEEMRDQTGKYDVSKLVGANACVGEPCTSHLYQ